MSPTKGRPARASRGSAGRSGSARAGTPPPAFSAGPPAPRAVADPWAWASALAVIPLVLRSLGGPLGEPVADDFDHLHHALFAPRADWLAGGGSTTFWRPLAYQGYFGLLANLILARPLLVVALHVALLAMTALLLYRVARRRVPAPWAAVIATFPLFAESTRALITVPVHFVDLGLLAFSSLAVHEAAAGRLATGLGALLAALLCKETGVATALILPFAAAATPARPARTGRWAIGAGLVTLAWGLAYLAVRARHQLVLPHGLESELATLAPHAAERVRWALAGSLRASFSLAGPDRSASAALGVEHGAAAVVLLLIGAALAILARSRRARARLAQAAPMAAVGLLWWMLATAPLLAVYPIWSPQRVAFGSVGLGATLVPMLGAAHPALLGGLLALRATTFALAPRPPAVVEALPAEAAAWVDFPRLVRLQRLMRETRAVLTERFPTLPRGATVVQRHLPQMTYYAFGGSKALQVWYRDTTLRWIPFDEFRGHPEQATAAVVEWQPIGSPQVAIVEPAAMRALIEASDRIAAEQWPAALAALERADALQGHGAARVFSGTVASKRALCLVALGRPDQALDAARQGLRLWPDNPDSRYAIATVLLARGEAREAAAELDSLLALYPGDLQARALRDRARQEALP